ETENLVSLRLVATHDALLCQGRMQINYMRHDGRTENTRRQDQTLAALESWNQQTAQHRHAIWLGNPHLVAKGHRNHTQQSHDTGFQRAKPTPLQLQKRK